MLMVLWVFQQQSVDSRWLTVVDDVKNSCSAENGSTKTGRPKQRSIKTDSSGANSKEDAAQEAVTECNVFCETVGNVLGETGAGGGEKSGELLTARSWEWKWKVDGVGWSGR